MNNASLVILENRRNQKLSEYKLDSESIKEFQAKISQVDEEESNKLGKELFEEISKKKSSALEEDELVNKVIELIHKGANIEYKDEKKGDFPLLICARKGYAKVAYVLLRAGANVNQVNNYLTTTVMAAARHGQKELLELLILLGADVNAKCFDGDNALMSAKRHNQQECFDILIKAQSYLKHRNLINQTILDIPGDLTFNLSEMPISIIPSTNNVISFEDTQNLLDEAVKKMERIK